MNKKEKIIVTNAIIKKADVRLTDNILNLDIELSGYGWGINYGGVALDTYDKETDSRIGTAYGCQIIINLLRAFEVDSLSKLVNLPIRVVWNEDGRTIKGIQHFIKDDLKNWFSYDIETEEKEEDEEIEENESEMIEDGEEGW